MPQQRIDLIKTVYSKEEYPKIIDINFNQLDTISISQQILNDFTINQFFQKYNELFYEIPMFGDTNSHEYLIKNSGEYINYDQDSSLIAALQDEINQLRKDLLESQIKYTEALSGNNFKIKLPENDPSLNQNQINQIFNKLESSSDSLLNF